MRDSSEDELAAWMARLSEGERAAFDPLFRALYPRALRLARLTLDEDHAADAAQSIMTNVFARAAEFDAGKAVLPWFYAVAANEIRSSRRRLGKRRQREVEECAGHEVPGDDAPERALLEAELRSCVQRAIASLDFESGEAIAAMLSGGRPAVPASTFRKRVSRAYGRLRLLLGGFDEE